MLGRTRGEWMGQRLAARPPFWALLACPLLLLLACSGDPGGQVPQPSGEAITAERVEVEGFGLARAWADDRQGSLALVLEFSQPLVAIQDFDSLVTVEGADGADGGWSLDEDNRTLRFPNAEANREYTVRIAAALTAADGTELGTALERTIHTGDLKPVAGFASQGSVLPARGSRGLPVVSLNVAEVDVEFLRVRDSAVPQFLNQYQRGGRRGSWDLEADWGDRTPLSRMAEPVYVNRFVLGGERNERLLTYLPVQEITELQEAGLYFAVMKRAGAFDSEFETAFFTVSDIGLHARAYEDQLFVHTASLETGAASNGVALQVLDGKGEVVYRGETDRNGNAVFDYALDAAHVLVASRGRDVSMLPFNQPALDLSEFAVAGRGQAWFDVFAWSGRDLYRPGETVRVSALLRDHDGRPVNAGEGGGQSATSQPLFVRLKQPDGRTFFETRLEPGPQGYYRLEREVPADAPTGRWQVEFRTDPGSREAVQGMQLRIEEFLPERMKLELASAAPRLAPGEPLRLEVEGAYLYGAPAAGNRFTATLAVAVERHPVEALPDHFFGDPTLELPRDARDVIDAELDGSGRLAQDIPLPEEARPVTPIAAVVTGSLYESGGRSVNRSLKRVLWPADALVGVRPLFDPDEGAAANARAAFELVRVDAEGRPQPAAGLEVTLVREHRDYHWRHDDEGGWNYDFTRRFEKVETRTVDAGQSATRLDFPVEWGEYRLEVKDPVTGLVMRHPFRAGWSWDDQNRGLDARPDKVKLALDQTAYRAGDTLEVTVTPPHPGKGLLLVETDRLLHVQAIDAEPGSTFRIPVTEDWERHDVYVTALVFRGGRAVDVTTPARAVGVVHVPMDRRDRRVAVGLKVAGQVRPEQPLRVTLGVPALAGQQAHATVSAVDIGITNITRFPVPDAVAHFFQQRRFGIDAWDVYGRVIESHEGGTARIRFGGDMALDALPHARRPTARVQTVDLFSGPVQLDAQGNATVELPVPDFNGTLRVSALVWSDEAYGNRDAETVVRAPIVAEASMPRVLAPGDRSTLTLDVGNFTGREGSFRVRVDGEGPLAVGGGERTLQLEAGDSATLSFPLSAANDYATARVRVRVEGNGESVDRRHDLPVRAAWPAVLRADTRVLETPAAVRMDASLAEGLMPGSVQAQMSLSAFPPIPFAAALQGALHYPYGCAEQTASRGYAALMLDDATVSMLGLEDVDAELRQRTVQAAFGRLASMQAGNGHFSMWGSSGPVNPVLTPYVAEFLLDARDAGFAVPETVLQKALERLNEDLLAGGQEFYGQDHRQYLKFAYQAHAGFVLARVNRAPLGTLRALFDNQSGAALSGLPLVRLGLALRMQGDTARGDKAIAEGFALRRERPRWLGDYSTPLRDAALSIALVHEQGAAKPAYTARAIDVGRELDARRNQRWTYLSTQEQIAIARLGKVLAADGDRRVAGVLWTGDSDEPVAATRVFGRRFDHAALSRGVRFEPSSEPPLYASLEVAGVPRSAPEADFSRLRVERSLHRMDGSAWTPGPLAEGEALIVAVSITADQAMPDALLTDLLPAGLEIENFNLSDGEQWGEVTVQGVNLAERSSAAELRHEEFRDDRYVAALNLDRGRTARVFYLVRAVTPGTYTVPPPMVEDMYRPELRGVGRAVPASITVVQP